MVDPPLGREGPHPSSLLSKVKVLVYRLLSHIGDRLGSASIVPPNLSCASIVPLSRKSAADVPTVSPTLLLTKIAIYRPPEFEVPHLALSRIV